MNKPTDGLPVPGHSDRTPAVPSRILLVDDEPVSRLMIGTMLKTLGYVIVEASGGEEALPMLMEEDFDLVLMDLDMPGMSGLQLARLVRQIRHRLQLPIIMVTGNEDRTVVVEAFRAGVNDYVTKPIDQEIVLARVDLQLQLKRAQDSLQQSEERYALAAAGSNDGLWDWDLSEGSLYCSDRMKAMLGLSHGDLSTVSQFFDLFHEEDAARARNDLNAHLRGESNHFESEVRMLHRRDGFRWMLCRGLAVRNEKKKAVRIAGSLTDITAGKVADALTGLPNRLLFVDRVQRCLDQFRRYPSRQFAILYLDIDGFKLINDSYGHDMGDEFLIEIARRLETAIRSCDSVVSRLGGDEFAILAENLSGFEGAHAIAERVIQALSAPIHVLGRELFARASIGITLSHDECETAEELIREADVAMYFAKDHGHLPFKVFAPEMVAETAARLEMGNELRSALVRDEMHLNYQPIVDITTNRTAGFEALLRWENGRLGSVSPAVFVPLAEDTGTIVEIGKFVIRSACDFASRLGRETDSTLMMSVNISTRQIISEQFVELVAETLRESGLPRHSLKLEVTETTVMQDPDQSIELLTELQESGVSIGLDDFGTGYSSLSYLHRVPLNMLKIDRSFVTEMFCGAENMAIVETIMTLAQSLGLDVVAEGVETREQLDCLRRLGCRYVQGFLFSEAVPEERVRALLSRDWSEFEAVGKAEA